MENLETKLINIINKFTRFQEFLNNLENREKFSEIKIRLSSAKPLLEQFESLYENITSLNPEKANTYDMLVFEDNYYATIGLADEILDFGNNKANESVESIKVAAPQVKLPSISLPKFSGKYTEWPTFYDTFTSVIDQNVNLSNLEKFQYLKSCLTDEASNVISSILISNDNYSSALNILKSRFENKRLIIQHHLNAIFNLPNITKDLKSLRLFIDTLIANLNSLKQLGRPTKYWDDIIIYLINTKFDLTTKNAWESETSNITIPSMNDMEIFLNKRCQTLEAVAFHSNNNKSNTNNNLTYKTDAHVTTNQKQLQSICALCKNAHIIYQCTKFLSMTLNERINTVKTLKLCYNCLRENHSSNRCFSRGCKQCLKRHHTLLHDNNQTLKHDHANQPINNSQPSTSTTLSTNTMQRFNILLPTALIKTFDKYGNPITLRAILDSGSQSSFLTSKAFKKLGLPFKNIHCNIKGIAQTTMKTSKLVSFKIYSCISNFNASISCFIIPKISDNIPSASFSIDNLNIPNSIPLADPKFYVNDEIDLLIGNEIFWNLLSNGQISLGKNKPTLQSTHLGWILAGAIHLSGNRIVNPSVQCNFANYSEDNIQYSTNEQNFTTHHKCESGGTSSKLYNLESPNIFYNLNSQYNTLITNNDLHKQVECFWKLEEIQGRVMSHEEQECENHFLETHNGNKDDRYRNSLRLDTNSKNIENYIISDKENQKTLGIAWNTRSDNLPYVAQFNLESGSRQVPTKRVILSKIGQIFDPLGLLGTLITQGKLIMQQLWQLKLGWDDCIPDDLYSTWNSFYSQLNILNSLHIPRRVLITSPTKIEMHGFCDASERAYGACVYLRSFNEQGEVKTTLLCSKSRVAPLKSITIPRLELCGAVLLCNLMKKVKTALNININETFYWTDSTIVLHWISSQSYDFKVFVSHRIAQIQTLSEPTDWYHVLSTENPADIISRGINPTMLNNCDLWWSGPLWLKTNDQLPIKDPIHSKFINFEISERKNSTLAIHTSIQSSSIISSMITKYSSLTKLIRVVAYLLKFINHLRSQSLYSNNKFLSTIDLHKAQLKIFQTIQEEEFAAEINAIKQGQLPKSSKLISLNPFIDKDGLLRVGGRLRHANVSFETKHPILISKSHPIVNLIIIYYHLKYLHSGSETTLAAIRQKFWIISGRSAVRQVLNRCVNCFKVNPSPAKAIMGDLPEVRVQSARPFLYCGVDYAGPIYIKEKLGRGKRNFKAYIVLFKCLSSKAVHIELVTDCTADTFLNALKRFMARRGKVYHIYSDNATTFVGADHELKKLKNLALSQEFKPYLDKLANDEITWHFIPPRSPNFGGIWESGIKGIKFHLKRIIGNSILTYEEMYTSLTLIESCINSRPLIPMSNDPTDYTALTPNHFLIGEQLTSPPEPNYLPCNHLSRFQLLEKLRQQFWRRWKREYLVQLQQRVKWKNTSTNLKIGELVLISDDNSPPLQWPLGRVIEVYPGADNVVRVALIKTKTGTFKRSVRRLCVLPI